MGSDGSHCTPSTEVSTTPKSPTATNRPEHHATPLSGLPVGNCRNVVCAWAVEKHRLANSTNATQARNNRSTADLLQDAIMVYACEGCAMPHATALR
jgi:hypothetical protein